MSKRFNIFIYQHQLKKVKSLLLLASNYAVLCHFSDIAEPVLEETMYHLSGQEHVTLPS